MNVGAMMMTKEAPNEEDFLWEGLPGVETLTVEVLEEKVKLILSLQVLRLQFLDSHLLHQWCYV